MHVYMRLLTLQCRARDRQTRVLVIGSCLKNTSQNERLIFYVHFIFHKHAFVMKTPLNMEG